MNDAPRTNSEIRRWYQAQTSRISELNRQWIAQGLGAKERAELAYDIRRAARLAARAMMRNPAEVEMLRARDAYKYGDPDGPTFELLVEKLEAAGFTGDALYEEVVEMSWRVDEEVNKRLGL